MKDILLNPRGYYNRYTWKKEFREGGKDSFVFNVQAETDSEYPSGF